MPVVVTSNVQQSWPLDAIERMPGSYSVWVDAGGHAGELRGTLFAGMAHMSGM